MMFEMIDEAKRLTDQNREDENAREIYFLAAILGKELLREHTLSTQSLDQE